MAETVDHVAPIEGELMDEGPRGEQPEVAESGGADPRSHESNGAEAQAQASTGEEREGEQPRGDATEDEESEDEEAASITELLVQLGHDVGVLAFLETQLAASRHIPEVRRTTRDVAGLLLGVLAFLTAFAFANVAAQHALATEMSPSLASLLLCAVWLVVGAAVTLALMVRAGRVTGWSWWRVFRGGTEESVEDLERARAEAEETVRERIGQLAPAMSIEIAAASVSVAGGMAGGMAGGVIDVGANILEGSDDMVDAIAEAVPGGGVVNQVWGVFLMPGRFGVRVATTVLRRGTPGSS